MSHFHTLYSLYIISSVKYRPCTNADSAALLQLHEKLMGYFCWFTGNETGQENVIKPDSEPLQRFLMWNFHKKRARNVFLRKNLLMLLFSELSEPFLQHPVHVHISSSISVERMFFQKTSWSTAGSDSVSIQNWNCSSGGGGSSFLILTSDMGSREHIQEVLWNCLLEYANEVLSDSCTNFYKLQEQKSELK